MTSVKITKSELSKRLHEDNFGDASIIVDFEVILLNKDISWHYRKIKDVVFKEKVVIRDAEINSGLIFENCTFEKEIVFHNVKSTNFNSTYNSKNESICFNNSKAELIIFEKECHLERTLTIKNNSKINRIELRKTTIDNGGFCIKKSEINYINLSNSVFDLNISNSIINKPSAINSLNGNVALISNEFKDWIKFWNIECVFSFTSNKNHFRDEFKIEGSRIKQLTLFNDVFNKKGELENRDLSGNHLETYIKKIYISETNFIEGFDFNGLGNNLEELNLNITPELRGVVNFDNWIIETTIISGVNQNLKLLLKKLKFRFLFINDFTNFNDISFDRCKGNGNESILNLINSDLGSTRFNEFDLKSFKILRLNNVSLDKIRPSNVNWFEDSQVEIEVHEQTDSERARRKREIYRQLKQALKNHGNQIDSLIFQARELKCLRDEFNNSKKYNWDERLIMTVSQSNDYGLNWQKPVGVVILITFLLYIVILPGISDKILFSFSPSKEDIFQTWDVFINNFKTFWFLFNPIRNFELTYGATIQSNWIYFLDLIHRVVLGIMFFQIIKAFRKYVSN